MTLTLDPRPALVWRTPHSLSVGVDEPLVIEAVGVAEERVLHALQTGSTAQGLRMIAARSGAASGRLEQLLLQLAPVLRTTSEVQGALEGLKFAVTGSVEASHAVIALLQKLGASVQQPGRGTVARSRSDRPDVVVISASFVVSPAHAAFWLRRDVPHLPLVFGDRFIHLGPWVRPGDTACLHCRERHRMDEDPTWAAQACQLLGRPAATLDALGIAVALPLLAQSLLAHRAEGPAEDPGTVLSVDPRTGVVRKSTVRPHPECCCRVLQGSGRAAVDEL